MILLVAFDVWLGLLIVIQLIVRIRTYIALGLLVIHQISPKLYHYWWRFVAFKMILLVAFDVWLGLLIVIQLIVRIRTYLILR